MERIPFFFVKVMHYKTFRKELKKAFEEHPGFKHWLKLKRNKNLLLTCYPYLKIEPFSQSLDELKQLYITECQKKQNALNMIRFMSKEFSEDATSEEKRKLEYIRIQTKIEKKI